MPVTLPGTGVPVATETVGADQLQLVKPVWGASGTATLTTATTPLPTSTNASIFRFSTGNTSAVQLTVSPDGGSLFSGARETALDQPCISLLMTCDQPVTLTIKQYIDDTETYAVPPIVYTLAANQGFSGSIGLNGNYVRVLVQNTGTATTTTFNLNTAYGSLPVSDANGRLPVSSADSVPLLDQTMTAVGFSSVIDTTGYQSIVAQISGIWSGNGTFESSNNLVDWDTVLVLSRDNITLIDSITSGGLYSIRPSGRYLRYNLASIIGSVRINAIGRASQGISGADMLSLAMDRQLNTPLFTELNDNSVAKLAPANSMVMVNIPVPASTAINSVIFQTDISAYRGVTYQSAGAMGTGAYQVQVSLNGIDWVLVGAVNYAGVVVSVAQVLNSTLGPFRFAVYAKFLRIILTTGTGTGVANLTLGLMSNAPEVTVAVVNSVQLAALAAGANVIGDVGQQYRANATGAATPVSVLSPATPAAATINGAAGRLLGWALQNSAAAVRSVKLFNAAAPTLGTTAAIFEIDIPAGGSSTFTLEGGISFATACTYSVTSAKGLTDNTATGLAANDVSGHFVRS